MTNNPFNWRLPAMSKARETHQRNIRNMDKARMPVTKTGGVPLIKGKYGMTVEEYLEWCRERSKRQDKLPIAKKTEDYHD